MQQYSLREGVALQHVKLNQCVYIYMRYCSAVKRYFLLPDFLVLFANLSQFQVLILDNDNMSKCKM